MKKFLKKILVIVVAILMLNVLFEFNISRAETVEMAEQKYALTDELKKKLANGEEYNSPINNLEKGQCTWYCFGRMYEKTGIALKTGNGNEWIEKNPEYDLKGKLQAPCIIVVKRTWLTEKGEWNNLGHVAFVEEIIGDDVIITEANVSKAAYGYKVSVMSKSYLESENAKFYRGEILGFIGVPEETVAKHKIETIPETINLDIKESEYKKADKLIYDKFQSHLGEGWNIELDWNHRNLIDTGKPLDAIHKISATFSYKDTVFWRDFDITYSNSQNWNIDDYNYVENIVNNTKFSKHLYYQGENCDIRNTNFDWSYILDFEGASKDESIKVIPERVLAPILPYPSFIWQDYLVYVFKDDVLYCGRDGTIYPHPNFNISNTVEDNSVLNIIVDTGKNISNSIFQNLKNSYNSAINIFGKKVTWSFNSENITSQDVDLNPEVIISNIREVLPIAGGVANGVRLDFRHNGNLPGKAKVNAEIGTEIFGDTSKTISLYYYNEQTGKYEFVQDVKYNCGQTEFQIDHCSSYVLVDILEQQPENNKLGDINSDDYIDTADARMILQYYVGGITLTDEQKKIADVNKDGIVDTEDARKILLYCVGQTQI